MLHRKPTKRCWVFLAGEWWQWQEGIKKPWHNICRNCSISSISPLFSVTFYLFQESCASLHTYPISAVLSTHHWFTFSSFVYTYLILCQWKVNPQSLSKVSHRPPWDLTTTPEQLAEAERSSFLSWRRNLAKLQEVDGITLTPFERNLEFWRQLWRVIERRYAYEVERIHLFISHGRVHTTRCYQNHILPYLSMYPVDKA